MTPNEVSLFTDCKKVQSIPIPPVQFRTPTGLTIIVAKSMISSNTIPVSNFKIGVMLYQLMAWQNILVLKYRKHFKKMFENSNFEKFEKNKSSNFRQIKVRISKNLNFERYGLRKIWKKNCSNFENFGKLEVLRI